MLFRLRLKKDKLSITAHSHIHSSPIFTSLWFHRETFIACEEKRISHPNRHRKRLQPQKTTAPSSSFVKIKRLQTPNKERKIGGQALESETLIFSVT